MISLIVPVYIKSEALYPLLSRFFESIPPIENMEKVIVNDCSPLKLFPEWISQADVYIENEENKGFTYTVNRGLEAAHGDILIISNDDLVLTTDLLERFSKISDGIYSPKTTDEGDGDYFGSLWGMTRNVYTKLGALDERLKHFYSDKEYYMRAKKALIPIIKWNDLIIEHEGGATYATVNKDQLYLQDDETYTDLYRRITS